MTTGHTAWTDDRAERSAARGGRQWPREPHDPVAGRPRSPITPRSAHAIALAAALIQVAGCAGYLVGNRTLYRTDLRTVQVPIFTSESLRPDLGEWLTEAVIKEIERRTPYKVVNSPLADSVLTGRILSDHKRVLAETINDEPRSLLFNAAVHVTWIDNRGQILTQTVISVGNTFVPEAGQSVTTAEQVVIERLAAQIVSEMETDNW